MDRNSRIREFYMILNKWMFMKNEGKNIGEILKDKGISSVAIYGMGDMARHIIRELKDTGCIVAAVIDHNENYYYGDIRTVKMGHIIESVDLIIHTDTYEMQENIEELKKIYKCKVSSLADVIYERF